MDTEKTLDLNKPLFSYSRYERNEYGYGDDFIHRDGDGVDMQVFFNQATGEFVSKGVSISDFTNLVEGKFARDTNAWTGTRSTRKNSFQMTSPKSKSTMG